MISTDYFVENLPVCWYPSRGYDFKHVFFWDYLKMTENKKFPKIFIHTDFTFLNYNSYPKEHLIIINNVLCNKLNLPIPHPVLYKGYILDICNVNALVIFKNTELFLEQDVFQEVKNFFQTK